MQKSLEQMSCDQLLEVIELQFAISEHRETGFPFTAQVLARALERKIAAVPVAQN